MKLYKITGMNGEAINGGSGSWHLPRGTRPGKWMAKVAEVRACHSGYHLIPAKAIFEWMPRGSGVLWAAEGRGDQKSDGEKIAFSEARLLKKVGVLDDVSMRLAAADIAERVLPIFLKEYPNDNRPALAIQAARDFARGKIDAAARAAAGDAARAAAGSAAWAAAGDANSRAFIKQARARMRELRRTA